MFADPYHPAVQTLSLESFLPPDKPSGCCGSLGAFECFTALIRRSSDPAGKNERERRGGKGMEEVFVFCL